MEIHIFLPDAIFVGFFFFFFFDEQVSFPEISEMILYIVC